MTKRQLIDEITVLNPTAEPGFLACFEDADLAEYLEHLHWLKPPEGSARPLVRCGAADSDRRTPFADAAADAESAAEAPMLF